MKSYQYVLITRTKTGEVIVRYYGPFDNYTEAMYFISMLDAEHYTFEVAKLLRPTANAD